MIINRTHRENASGNFLRIAIGISMLVLLLGNGASAATITVPIDYAKIQWAIDNATSGDTIEVDSGTYYENVNVTQQLTLRGVGNPVVDAGGNGSAITLSADGITLEGFSATYAKDALPYSEILVTSSSNMLISNNVYSNWTYFPIGYGITLYYSGNNTLIGNNASNNGYGISLFSSSNNTLTNNNAQQCRTYGIYLDSSNNNTLMNNNANARLNGIYLDSSSNNMLIGNIASHIRYDGIVLNSSNNNTLSNNNANSNGGIGIILDYSSNNALIDNNASSNQIPGIWLSYSSNNALIGNNASNNGMGIYLDSYSNNKIYHNNLINNNPTQARDNIGNNVWDNGYPSGGNNWSDYTGVDINSGPSQNIPGSDGIGDTPYLIPGGSSVDRYPLMSPYTGQPPTPSASARQTLPVRFTTDKAIYTQREQVIFTLINNGTDVIDLPNLAPWWVDNATTGERIFSPIAAQVITLLDPGKSESWIWDQNDSEGRQVQPGTYRGGISSSIGVNYTKEFEITTAPLITPTATPIPPAGTCLGDITGDSNVNSDDFVLFAIAYDSASGDLKYNVKADMNNNGVINSEDFVLFASGYGKAC